MEDIKAIKIYIQNNYPNIIINGNDNCILITNDKNCKTYKKLKDQLEDEEVSCYLTEFKLKSRKVFTDIAKFNKFTEYNKLWKEYLKYYSSHKDPTELVIMEWVWLHDNKTEILIDIESYDDDGWLYGAIFKDQEIMYLNKDCDILPQNNIDKDLIKRTKSFSHIKLFECEGDDYDEEHQHQYCWEIINYREDKTEYYGEDIIPLQVQVNNEVLENKEDKEDVYDLQVIPYDVPNGIYKEPRHGFLVKEINDVVCCYKKVVNGQEIELSDEDKQICTQLFITYQRF